MDLQLINNQSVASALDYFRDGGFVMPVLAAVGVLLWILICQRLFVLHKGFTGLLVDRLKIGSVKRSGVFASVIEAYQSTSQKKSEARYRLVELAVRETENRLVAHRKSIGALCAVAPLLGLLGTVSGMIETFASLVSMALFAKSGGVGGGISEALISTQMGLTVAVPGLIASRLLQHREQKIKNEMHVVWQQVKQQCNGERHE